jgi:MraZ protein
MFLGQFQLHLNNDHSLVIPKPFHGLLADGAYITRGFDHNLVILSEKTFQEIYKRVAGLNIADPLARLLLRLIFGNAARLEISKTGHVFIPKDLLPYASLEEDLILVGQGDYCEVWAPTYWDKQTINLLDTEANATRFAQLNLALA